METSRLVQRAVKTHAAAQRYGAKTPHASPYRLRAGLRRLTESGRERQCGVVSCRHEGPGIEARGRPGAWRVRWIGVVSCGHVWTCPVCSERIRAKRLARCHHVLRASGGRWQMLSLTIRHTKGMPLRWLLAGLMKAWRACKQGGSTQRIFAARVTASARATEVTHGKKGWHPHLHVLLRTSEWSDADRAALLERWQRAVRKVLGDACVPSDERAIRWSEPVQVCEASDADVAAYVFKLGLELHATNKDTRGEKPWELLERAIAGDEDAKALWSEYSKATRGRRMLELDDRAALYLRIPLRDHEELVEEVRVARVDSLELGAMRQLERRDPELMGVILASIAGSVCPETALRRWIALVERSLRYNPVSPPWKRVRFEPTGPPENPCPFSPASTPPLANP